MIANKFINNNQLKEFHKKGWIKIKDVFSKNEIKKITNEILRFLEINAKKYNPRFVNYSKNMKNINEINSFHKLADSKFFRNISKQKKISNIAKSLLSISNVNCRAIELFAKPAKIGLNVPIHQDNFFWCVKNNKALTIWVALDKVNKSNGGIFFFNGSHKKGIWDHVPSYHKGTSQKLKNLSYLKKNFKAQTPTLKPGDCLVHHCLTVHGSNQNLSKKKRRGFTFQFKDYYAKYDLKRKKDYEKSLKYQIKSRV